MNLKNWNITLSLTKKIYIGKFCKVSLSFDLGLDFKNVNV